MDLREVTKKNYQKILRDISPSEFPSVFQDQYLVDIREKILKKEKLLFSEEQISYHRLKKYIEDYKNQINRYYVQKMNFSKFSHRPPLLFQEDGIKFLLSNDRCILADDTGLGKSISATLAALCLQEDFKILLVTMKTLKYNFEREIAFYCDSYKVIEDKWESEYKFTIIHYDSTKKWLKDIEKEKFDCVIADECHVLINPKTKRTQNFAKILENKSVKKLWLLTGTPITNRPFDYFNLLKLIKHPLAKNWQTFVKQYCDGYQNYFGQWITDGSSNEMELHEKTKDVILRRLKKDNIKDLPNKDRQPIFLKMTNWKGYNKMIDDYKDRKKEELFEAFGGSMPELIQENDINSMSMTKLILWRQFCALEKIRDGSLIELITTQIEQGNKIIVFTNFTSVIDAVFNHFGKDVSRFVDGRMGDAKKRLEFVEEFNNNNSLRLLILNLQVAVGLNIQSANIGIINDMYWVPGIMLQAEDRMWRIGQTRDVTILYPIYDKTVETILYDTINKKMKIISTIVEGKKESFFTSDEIEKEKSNKSILKEIFDQLDLF